MSFKTNITSLKFLMLILLFSLLLKNTFAVDKLNHDQDTLSLLGNILGDIEILILEKRLLLKETDDTSIEKVNIEYDLFILERIKRNLIKNIDGNGAVSWHDYACEDHDCDDDNAIK